MLRSVARSTTYLTSTGSKAKNVRTAVSLRDLRARIKSITAISKLTKTMQLVASSRMKAATIRAENANHLQKGSARILSVVEPDKEQGENLVISVVSDKGMCGSVNNQAAKFAKSLVNEDRNRHSIASIGTKASGAFAAEYPLSFLMSMKDVGKKEFTFAETSLVVDQVLQTAPKTTGYDQVRIAFNKFKNVITYIPTEISIPGTVTLQKNINKLALYEFDEAEDITLRDLFEFQVASSLWGALNSSRNSELAARMTSMDNATKSAQKIIAGLTVTYNRGRQAAITTELVEICSGAAAVQDAAAAASQ